MKIYHNPRCSKSRAGLNHLEEKGVKFVIVDYLKEPLSVEELSAIFEKLNKKPSEMVRQHEELYKKEYKGKDISEEEWIKIFAENPRLLHRPIFEAGDKAVWGQPVDNIDTLL